MPVNACLVRVVVSVGDLERALGFYRDLLGLEPVLRPGFARLPLNDRVEVLLHERPSSPSDTAVAVSFGVSGLDERCVRWEQRGGAVIDPPAAQPWGERMAVVRDPDGHLVCLVETA